MINVNDFVTLKVNEEILLEAIDYACRSIHFTYDRMNYGPQFYNRLIRVVVGITIEKTFEEYLIEKKAIYSTEGRTHWRVKDKVEFIVGTKRLDIKGYHVYPANNRHFPEWFLDVEGLVPKDQLERAQSPDAYLQAFLVCPQVNRLNTNQFVSIFPRSWANRWREPRQITVDSTDKVKISINGEDQEAFQKPIDENHDVSEELSLPGSPIDSNNKFCSLEYAKILVRPQHSLTVQIFNDGNHQVAPSSWVDLWLQDPQVTFTGWGLKQDYNSGIIIPFNAHTKIYTGGTRTVNYSRPIQELRSLRELING